MAHVIESTIEDRFVDIVATKAKAASEEVIGELSFDFVHGYMNGAFRLVLKELKLTKKQQQILEQHTKI